MKSLQEALKFVGNFVDESGANLTFHEGLVLAQMLTGKSMTKPSIKDPHGHILVGSDNPAYATIREYLADDQKIYAIKALRNATGLRLKESKDAIDQFQKDLKAQSE